MDFNPIKIASQLDQIADSIEKSANLTPVEKNYFAYRIDKISDKFEKAAAKLGYGTKNGQWLMGDVDEKGFMARYDQTGAIMQDEDEEYMKSFENTIGNEEQSISTHKEPPIRDLQTEVKVPGPEWKNAWRDNTLTEGNKVAKTIPKRKV